MREGVAEEGLNSRVAKEAAREDRQQLNGGKGITFEN